MVMGMLYVLLGFSVIVSLFGMVNTMVLSVFERTREIGMLRTIGMTRRQARRMIRHESIITALIGTALGVGLGLFLSALVTQAVSMDGLAARGARPDAGGVHAARGRSPASARRSCPHGAPRASTCWRRCTTSRRPTSRRSPNAPAADSGRGGVAHVAHPGAVSGSAWAGGGQRRLNFARDGGPSRRHGFASKFAGEIAPFTGAERALSRKMLSR